MRSQTWQWIALGTHYSPYQGSCWAIQNAQKPNMCRHTATTVCTSMEPTAGRGEGKNWEKKVLNTSNECLRSSWVGKSQFNLITLKYFNFKKTIAYWKQVYFRHLRQSGPELIVQGMQQWFPQNISQGSEHLNITSDLYRNHREFSPI